VVAEALLAAEQGVKSIIPMVLPGRAHGARHCMGVVDEEVGQRIFG